MKITSRNGQTSSVDITANVAAHGNAVQLYRQRLTADAQLPHETVGVTYHNILVLIVYQ